MEKPSSSAGSPLAGGSGSGGEFSSKMETPTAADEAAAVAAAAAAWEWGSLLDFSIEDDDHLILPWAPDEPGLGGITMSPLPPPPPLPAPVIPPTETSVTSPGRVRKRDPRLLCENFQAGRVPCACPEVDEKDGLVEWNEAGTSGGGKKRARTGGSAAVRCQVQGCEADISELKGYHKRHRVCLRCANAGSVALDGDHKRYCQQCGKFHVLADFDEGKRSCRRKLERHNKRRRRRPTSYKDVLGNENGGDVAFDEEQNKDSLNGSAQGSDNLCISNKNVDAETLTESEERGSPFSSDPSTQMGCIKSVASFAVSSEAQIAEKTDNNQFAISSGFCENKSVYSTTCPTGRISFKLYDWNPAEFPRRLRHQIFEWLASMPVELEGYIRPGCTILTIFIAMPHPMWNKLSRNAAHSLHDLVKAPESLLFRRGNIHIYLNNTIFQVLKDGSSLMNVKMEVQVPKLHYIHPFYFEAGKAMEFIACGSNLRQQKLRFLVSFAGKYLSHETCDINRHKKMEPGANGDFSEDSEHEIFTIKVPHIESNNFGPAFVEVENESGLSNFIPILFADKYICSELKRLQHPFCYSPETDTVGPSSCQVYMHRQSSLLELFLDIGWLLKETQLEHSEAFFSIGNIQRLNNLLGYLVQSKAVGILRKIVGNVEALLNINSLGDFVNRSNINLLEKSLKDANQIICEELPNNVILNLDLEKSLFERESLPESNARLHLSCSSSGINEEGEDGIIRHGVEVVKDPGFRTSKEEDYPLLNSLYMEGSFCDVRAHTPLGTYDTVFSRSVTNTRLAILVMASIVVCLGFCVVLFHPHKVGEFTVSVRRCVFGMPRQ